MGRRPFLRGEPMATITYKCPNCGGGMIFDPASQKFKCEFCLSEYTQAQLDELQKAGASDQVFEESVAEHRREASRQPVQEHRREASRRQRPAHRQELNRRREPGTRKRS